MISVGAVAGGSADALNVMPAKVVLGGTARSYTLPVRDTMERRMRELATGLAASFNCTAEVEYDRLGTALVNHAEQTARAVAAATSLVGAAAVDGNCQPVTGGEDFASMLEAKPGAFVFLGQGAGGATSEGLHTPTYDFNDDAIAFGTGFWVNLVMQEMASPS